MKTDLSLHQRRRNPTAAELAGIPWLKVLKPDAYERAASHVTPVDVTRPG